MVILLNNSIIESSSVTNLLKNKKRIGLKLDIFEGKYKSLYSLPYFAMNLRLDSDKISGQDREFLNQLREYYLNSFREWRDIRYSEVLQNPSRFNLAKFRQEQLSKNDEMEDEIIKRYIKMKEEEGE